MSKKYFLEKWFRIADILEDEMIALFTENNVPYLKINQMPEADMKRWQEIKKKLDRIARNVTKIILS